MATTNGQSIIGHLTWEITEPHTGKTLGQGDRDVLLQEVSIETVEGGGRLMMKKQIALDATFAFGMAEAPSADKSEKMMGFGLTADRTDEQTFSWEWFVPESETHAVKLQETGELAFTTAKVGSKWEVVQTEFQTDVSLRVSRMDAAADPLNPTWRILIKKGSAITWPSLVDGKVVAN